MAPRQSGLGESGRQRSRENLGAGTAGGDVAHPQRGSIKGSDSSVLENALFGPSRPGGALLPLPEPPTDWKYPGSSRVYAYQYDPEMSQLRVKFVKYGTPWVYDSVPSTVFEVFDASPSKGSYINSTLNYFPYRKAIATEVAAHFDSV